MGPSESFCRCGGTGIRAALKTQSFGIRVRTPSSAPKLLLGGPRLLGNKNQNGGIGESTDRGSAPPAKWLGPLRTGNRDLGSPPVQNPQRAVGSFRFKPLVEAQIETLSCWSRQQPNFKGSEPHRMRHRLEIGWVLRDWLSISPLSASLTFTRGV